MIAIKAIFISLISQTPHVYEIVVHINTISICAILVAPEVAFIALYLYQATKSSSQNITITVIGLNCVRCFSSYVYFAIVFLPGFISCRPRKFLIFFAAGHVFNFCFADRGFDFMSISDIVLNLDLVYLEMLCFSLTCMATSIATFLN